MKPTQLTSLLFGTLLAGGIAVNAAADDHMQPHAKAPQNAHDNTQQQMGDDTHYDGKHQADPKMKQEVQEQWREDAEERRESDVRKPEQGG